MDKGTSASWEQVHRIFFPGGPVPASLINPNVTAPNTGAGILGPGPAAAPFINGPSTSSPAPPFVLQSSAPVPRVGHVAPPPPPLVKAGSRRKDENSHFGAPPAAPRDPKTLYYVKLVAAFVSKFGREYETMVRSKQHGKPEFGFLYGGHPGSEPGLGNRYYEWQKDVLVKVSETKKAVSEGNMPPDRLKSMQRELEKHLNGGQALKDLRIESILGLQDQLDWQKVAWEFGVTLPGKRTTQVVETTDKDSKMKTPTKADGGAFVDPTKDNKADRVRRKDDHDSAEEFSPSGRRRRKRSRSPSPGSHRYRSRSPQRSPRRSPSRRSPRRSRSPPQRRGRSYSRSPPRRRTPPPVRRAGERKREGDERRDGHESVESVPFPKPHTLLPVPVPQMVSSQEHARGFAVEDSFLRFSQGSTQLHALPDAGLLRVPPAYPQLGVAFPPPLPDIQVQQQQFLFQQLQLAQIPNLAAQPLTNTWPASDVQHVLVNRGPPPPIFDQPMQQQQQLQLQQKAVVSLETYDHQLMQQQQQLQQKAVVSLEKFDQQLMQQQQQLQLQQKAVVNSEKHDHQPIQQQQQLQQNALVNSERYDPLRPASPSNDVEMEVGSTSPKTGEPPEAVTSKSDGNGKAGEDRGKAKKADKEKDNDETNKTKRALKIVRNTVADFVKELLNPKWRDGILSKDDFKVIAQKAVNKVVGNLQGSQIPKGPDRLERFMASSKEKITKLVQEYVEKHTKNAPAPAPAPAAPVSAPASA